jgi:choline dehydrogenase-like flavoprotein
MLQCAMEEYATTKTGPLATGGIFSYAFLALQETLQENGMARIRQLIQNMSYPEDQHPLKAKHAAFVEALLQNPNESTAGFFTYAAQGNFGKGSGSELMKTKFLPGHFYSIAICLLQPLSRGYVHIQSYDPSVPVKINPKYLSHPLDMEVLARHMTYIATIIETEPLKSLLRPGGLRNAAAPEALRDLDAVREYVKDTALSSWHPTSTCAMLPSDLGGVVDPRLVVHGTKNLRVVDASVFPITTRGNPMATVYTVAERASDIIKENLRLRRERQT